MWLIKRIVNKHVVNQENRFTFTRNCLHCSRTVDLGLYRKALRNWEISVKALMKRLWKLTIKTKQLSQLKLTINR